MVAFLALLPSLLQLLPSIIFAELCGTGETVGVASG
jgi:hypothetical protein